MKSDRPRVAEPDRSLLARVAKGQLHLCMACDGDEAPDGNTLLARPREIDPCRPCGPGGEPVVQRAGVEQAKLRRTRDALERHRHRRAEIVSRAARKLLEPISHSGAAPVASASSRGTRNIASATWLWRSSHSRTASGVPRQPGSPTLVGLPIAPRRPGEGRLLGRAAGRGDPGTAPDARDSAPHREPEPAQDTSRLVRIEVGAVEPRQPADHLLEVQRPDRRGRLQTAGGPRVPPRASSAHTAVACRYGLVFGMAQDHPKRCEGVYPGTPLVVPGSPNHCLGMGAFLVVAFFPPLVILRTSRPRYPSLV